MDKELAQLVAMTASRCTEELAELVLIVKNNCDEPTYDVFLKAFGRAIHEIQHEVIDRVFKIHPELEKEFEQRLNKYGRTYY
jgi:hypothetical protein